MHFELIDFANKIAATVNVNNAGATTTVDTTTASAGLSSLFVNSGAGTDTIDVQATPSGVTTTTDTGSVTGSTTSVGLNRPAHLDPRPGRRPVHGRHDEHV